MRYKKHLTLLTFLFAVWAGISAQSNTMYYLRNVPQTYYLNPAFQPQPNVFIGCPVLSTAYFDLHHNSLTMSDFFWNDPGSDQVLDPLTSPEAMSEFLAKLGESNNMSSNLDFNLASLGFRVKDLYFMFDITSKGSSGISFPNELVNFAVQGNEDYQEFNFGNVGFHMGEYVEVGLGASYKIGDMITAGVRPKMLFGMWYMASTNNQISLNTSHELWELNSHVELQMATPGVIFPVDAQGSFDPSGEIVLDTALTNLLRTSNIDTLRESLGAIRRGAAGNKGFGIDFGVNITPMDELTISLSVLDLGFINWNNYAYEANMESSFEFSGVTYNSSENSTIGGVFNDLGGDGDSSTFFQGIIDTVLSHFDGTGGVSPFRTRLDPKIFIGADYSVLPSLSLGLLARFDIPQSGLNFDMMLHADWHPSTFFALSLSYSPFEGGASTFGLGASFRSGPLSYYIVADYNALRYTVFKYETEVTGIHNTKVRNIPVMLTADNRDAFNLRVGLNLVFGWNQRKKLMKDKPMYFSKDY